MSSQDGHPSNPRPLKRRRIAHDRLSATSGQNLHPPRTPNSIYDTFEDSKASTDIRQTTPLSRRSNPSPTIRQSNDNFIQRSQATRMESHQTEDDDVVQTSDIEELLITEDHELILSPQNQRLLLRTSSSSGGHPAYTSPPPTSTPSKSRSPAASFSSDMEREQLEPAMPFFGSRSTLNSPESTVSQPTLMNQAGNSSKSSSNQKTLGSLKSSTGANSRSTNQPLDTRQDYPSDDGMHSKTVVNRSDFQKTTAPVSSSLASTPNDRLRVSQSRSGNETSGLSSPIMVQPIEDSTSRPLSRSPSSSLLSSAPPSPPRRRTRESNKFFKPYTDYRKRFGDIELVRLERLEKEKEKHGPKHTTVEDDVWVASQTQLEGESQLDFTNFRREAQTSATKHQPKTYGQQKPRSHTSSAIARPAKNHERNQKTLLHSSRKEHNERQHTRDLHAKPSIIHRPRKHMPNPPSEDVRLASKDAISKALQKLYEDDDESEEDGNPFTAPISHKAGDKLPESDIPTEGEEEESQLLPHRSRNHVFIAEEDDDEGGDEHSSHRSPAKSQANVRDGSESETDQEETDDEIENKRQRILGRIWPAVMIRKDAEAARAKELERQRKLRDEERARRAQLGLSDGDMSDVQDEGNVVPGESRTRRLGSIPIEPVEVLQNDIEMLSDERERPAAVPRGHTSRKEVIDISSDQESLDNDLPEDKLVASLSSSDETEPFGSELEAVEDNTVHGYGRSKTDTRVAGRRRYTRFRSGSGWNERRPVMRQTRIDRMLNSTRYKSSRSRKTLKEASAQGQRKHPKNRNSTGIHLPPNTHMVASSPHMLHQIQTRLPFQPIQDDGSDKKQHSGSTNNHKNRSGSGRGEGSSSKHRNDRGSSRHIHSKQVPKELLRSVYDVLAPVNRTQYAPATSTSHSNQSRPSKSKPPPSKHISHTNVHSPYQSLLKTRIEDPHDPDAKIDISLRTALAFGARRSRAGFAFPSSAWISQGRLLDLIHVLCQRSEPSEPLPCRVSTLQLTAQTSIPDLQVQFPTICDLLFDMISQRAKPSQDPFTSGQNLMRFICLYVSWIGKNEAEEAKDMLRLVRTQVDALMERVDEWVKVRNRTGQEFDHALFSIHWFSVEISSRITAALSLQSTGQEDVVFLNDPDTDRYTIKLISRLLEYGPRRAGQALQNRGADIREAPSVAEYALELWVALIHIVTLIPETEEEFTETSATFWRLLVDALDQSNRSFASAVHESEFIFATIFTVSSISSIGALGSGQEERRLRSYWPIVCRALTCVNLAPDNDPKRKLPQNIVAAKDTYIGMLFARCNVLAFRWDWSLQEPQYSNQLLHALRDALKNRKFMNLVHEQSDFPSFITQQDFNLLHQFDPKDSIQTILIKLMIRKTQASPQGLSSAKKWISLLSSTSKLEFRKDTPPTQKELSVLFNQFTIKLVLLYISPDPNNVRVLVNNSKDIIGFKEADMRSRQVCVRAAMIFGRFCQHFGLPSEEPIKWLAEMGIIVLEESTLLGLNATSRQLKDTGLLCALVVASVRDILGTRSHEEEEPPTFPALPNSMISFLARLLPLTKRYSACLPEIALLLKVVFDLRSVFIPPLQLPQLPAMVVEEESQGDYGFEPIDVNDPSLIQAFAADGNQNGVGSSELSVPDTTLANAMSELTSLIASLIPRLSHADVSEREEADVELWIDCWARTGVILVAHRLKDWEYFLQRSPAALGRLDDFDWSQQMEPVYRLRILREDPKVYEAHKEGFLKVFFAALIARDSDLLPSYVWTVIRVDGMKHLFLSNIPFRRDGTEQEFEEEYHESRLELVQVILHNVDRAYRDAGMETAQVLKLGAEAVENVAFMLKNLRYNVLAQKSQQNPGQGPSTTDRKQKSGWSVAESEYARFSSDVIAFLRNLDIHGDPRIAQLLDGLDVIDLTAEE